MTTAKRSKTEKTNADKMNQATALTKPQAKGIVEIPAIGTGKIVKIDPNDHRSFEDVGLGTGLFPDDVQIGMTQLVGKVFKVVDAKIGLKGIIAGKETEYGVVRCLAEKSFTFLPPDAPEYEEGTKEYDELAITIEAGQFFTTATGGIVCYRQVCAAVAENLLPLETSVFQTKPKAKGMNGYYYFAKEAKSS